MNLPIEKGLLAATHPPAEHVQARWTEERVTAVRWWTPHLLSFRTSRQPGFRFIPGQFARLGLPGENGDTVWRAYSIASADYADHLEFYAILVPGGAFSTRLTACVPGMPMRVERSSYGFLTADRFAAGRDLWMLASGTGLAPFLSILHDPRVWCDYENLVLVHSVRHADELAYRDDILALPRQPLLSDGSARLHYLPAVTREPQAGRLAARITMAIRDGSLETVAGIRLDPAHSRLMICGNPQMATDLRCQLGAAGFRVGRRNEPGQLAFENYW